MFKLKKKDESLAYYNNDELLEELPDKFWFYNEDLNDLNSMKKFI